MLGQVLHQPTRVVEGPVRVVAGEQQDLVALRHNSGRIQVNACSTKTIRRVGLGYPRSVCTGCEYRDIGAGLHDQLPECEVCIAAREFAVGREGVRPVAGGISAAPFHRERTGEAVQLDVSLLSTAWWAAGASVTQGMETGQTMRSPMPNSVAPTVNPFLGNYLTSDGDAFEHLGLPAADDDSRFSEVLPLIENAAAAVELIAGPIRSQPFDYWSQHLKTMKGKWTGIASQS